MLQSPKKRICPSDILQICSNNRRQPDGDTKGNRPSNTSTSANASQTLLPSTDNYFLRAGALAPSPEPRMALKKSEEGSSTITSLFLLKLAL